MTRSIWVRAAVAALLCTAAHAEPVLPAATALTEIVLDIKAQPVRQALQAFGEQTGLQVLFRSEGLSLDGVTSLGVSGKLSTREALERLLRETGLQYEFINQRTVRISAVAATSGLAPGAVNHAEPVSYSLAQAAPNDVSSASAEPPAAEEAVVKGIPEVMVFGKKSLNTDIERTEDDPQPYVVFDRAVIERSGASSVNDFLLTRLPMNVSGAPPRQLTPENGGMSGINLRGLGANQTLILIDGRRAAKTSRGGTSGQTDINGIPLDAIERIEVLPTTASAIYGGSATGGVINIVMRRDYVGTEAAVTYDNSFDSDSAVKRIDLSSGFNLFDGKTNVLLVGSYEESNALLIKDRDFIRRARQRILANNPAYLSTPPLSVGTNIRSSNGSALVLDDGRALGSFYTSVPVGYGGLAADGGAALLANAGTYHIDPSNSTTLGSGAGGNTRITGGGPATKYFSASVRHEFSEKVKSFLEVSRSENDVFLDGRGLGLPLVTVDADAPGNPFQQDVAVSWTTQQLGSHREANSQCDRYGAGFIVELPARWTASLDYTWSKSKYSRIDETPNFGDAEGFAAAVADGSIDLLRDFDSQGIAVSQFLLSNYSYRQTPLEVTTKNPALRLSGPLGSLPAGEPRLSLLLERQDTKFGTSIFYGDGFDDNTFYPERTQKVDSAYLELRVPLLSAASGLSWARELELQLAGRWDRYQSVNAAGTGFAPGDPLPDITFARNKEEEFSPLVALLFRPLNSVTLRASYGTGFLPPDINQLTAPTTTPDLDLSGIIDPRRGNTGATGIADYTCCGNPDLKPETSTTWSAGIILTPTWLEGLRLSVDYTQIEKEGNIALLSFAQLLADEASFPGRIIRGANLPGDPAGWAGPITGIDASYINAARTKVAAYDMQLDYTLPTDTLGTFGFYAMATWQTQFDLQTTPSSLVVDNVGWTTLGAQGTPLDLRGNLGLEWSMHRWTLNWTTRYSSSYYVANPALASSARIFRTQGDGGRVPSQTYHDISGKYRFERASNASGIVANLVDGLEIQAGVRNVFNTKPPVDLTSFYYMHSGLGDPRMASYYITLRRAF